MKVCSFALNSIVLSVATAVPRKSDGMLPDASQAALFSRWTRGGTRRTAGGANPGSKAGAQRLGADAHSTPSNHHEHVGENDPVDNEGHSLSDDFGSVGNKLVQVHDDLEEINREVQTRNQATAAARAKETGSYIDNYTPREEYRVVVSRRRLGSKDKSTKGPTVFDGKGTKAPSMPVVETSTSEKASKGAKFGGSMMPSGMPSMSAVPSGGPTESLHPSGAPSKSREPSDVPSMEPSESVRPSTLPSDAPSLSVAPSNLPSVVPSLSTQPSGMPSSSARPSLSLEPSGLPSLEPSVSTAPSDMPSPCVVPESVTVSMSPDGATCLTSNSSADITAACACLNQTCCVGANACEWPDDARQTTICRGACYGPNACKDIGPGSVIYEYACREAYAWAPRPPCEYLASLSMAEIPAKIGKGSCNGCSRMAQSSPNAVVTVDTDACVGTAYSCVYLGVQAASISIGRGALQGTNSYILGGTTLIFEPYSCNDGCSGMGSYASNIFVGQGSCRGLDSCRFAGGFIYGNVSIGRYSCNATQSCQSLGYSAYYCYNYSGYRSGDVVVGDGSCTAASSCAGTATTGSAQIGRESCTGVKSCYNIGELYLQSVVIGDGACLGTESCFETAKDLTGASTASIGDGACIGDKVCDNCSTVLTIPSAAQYCTL